MEWGQTSQFTKSKRSSAAAAAAAHTLCLIFITTEQSWTTKNYVCPPYNNSIRQWHSHTITDDRHSEEFQFGIVYTAFGHAGDGLAALSIIQLKFDF